MDSIISILIICLLIVIAALVAVFAVLEVCISLLLDFVYQMPKLFPSNVSPIHTADETKLFCRVASAVCT